MKFLSELPAEFASLDKAWSQYKKSNKTMLAKLLKSVSSWRWASGGMFPEHPLFGQADTSKTSPPWTEFENQWIADDDPRTKKIFASRHGFDSQQRIVFQQKTGWGKAYFHGGLHTDEFYFEIAENGKLSKSHDKMRRFFYDEKGRIDRIATFDDEDGTKFYSVERFKYQKGKSVESVVQWYEVMPELPSYHEDDSEEELREAYRPIKGKTLINNLVETMYRRKRTKFTYDSNLLIRAEVFDGDGQANQELLFERKPRRDLTEISADLANRSADTIFKAAKKRAPGKPFRGLVLIYSAEHAHCGLPHAIKTVLSDQDFPADAIEWESYENDLGVAFKRPVLSCLTEFNQRCYAEFGIEGMDDAAQAAKEVMKAIATNLVNELRGTKHVSDDFRVLYVDDHGDVDGGEVH